MTVYVITRHEWEEDHIEEIFANCKDAVSWIESTFPNAEHYPETRGARETWDLPGNE